MNWKIILQCSPRSVESPFAVCFSANISDLGDLPGVYGTISSSKYVGALPCNDLKT